MIRKLLLILAFLLPASAGATAYTASTSSGTPGNWNTASTWGGAGVPGNGDTATIPTGKGVVCTDAETVGTNVASNLDLQITGTGLFKMTDGCVFSMRGNIIFDQGASFVCQATSANSTFQFVVPGGDQYLFEWSINGSSPFAFTFTGSSPTALCIMTTTTGGGSSLVTNGGHAVNLTINVNYAVFSNMGNASTVGVNFVDTAATVSPSINHTLFDNDGMVQLTLGTKTLGFTWNALDFRRCLDTSNGSKCLQLTTAGTAATPRIITNLTAESIPTVVKNVSILMPNVQLGESKAYGDAADIPGYLGYNTQLSFAAAAAIGDICRMCITVGDVGVGSASYFVPENGAGTTYQDVIALEQIQNQKQFSGTGTVNTTPDVYSGIVCDGNGMAWVDTGNCITDGYTFTVRNFLCVNEAGDWNSAGSGSPRGSWFNSSTFFCNTATTDGDVYGGFRNNLMTYPGTPNPGGNNPNFDTAGFGNTTSTFARQTQLSLDYNFFYGMPGSGDSVIVPGATLSSMTCSTGAITCLLPNPSISATAPSYVNVPTVVTPLQASHPTTAGTTTATHVVCPLCSFVAAGLQAGDYVCDNTANPFTCAPIANSTIAATTLDLVSPGIATLNGTGHNVIGTYGYMSTAAQYYGSTAGYGTHDQHTNPQFVDASRTLCTWYNKASGATAECSGQLTGNIPPSFKMIFTSTAGTDTTHIFCSTCHFNSWGLGTYTVVQVYSTTTTTVRGRSTVSAVTSDTELTLSTAIGSTASGDLFTFVTATQGIAYGALAINGWDYGSGSGNGAGTPVAVTPVTWSNPANVLSYIRAGFTPMNGQLKNAAKPSDCTTGNAATCDIGALPVYPATSMVIL